MRAKVRKEWGLFLLFAGPNLVLFGLFTYWPIVYSAFLSLTDARLIAGEARFVGLANYGALLSDETFWRVCLNTLVFAVAVVGVAQSLALGLAHLLHRPIPGRGVFRVIAFTPYVTTTAAAALAWVLILDPRYGPLGVLYGAMGIEGPDWLSSGFGSLAAITVVGAWKEIGIAMIFFLAGLQGLPKDCFEAARVDGCGAWGRFRRLTLPLLSPVILFLAVAGFIAAFKAFEVVLLMTEGGPVYPDSSTYVFHLYKVGFRDYRAGEASAMAVIFFGAIVIATALQLRAARRWVHYE